MQPFPREEDSMERLRKDGREYFSFQQLMNKLVNHDMVKDAYNHCRHVRKCFSLNSMLL